jgi:hypothetical protein
VLKKKKKKRKKKKRKKKKTISMWKKEINPNKLFRHNPF